MTMRVKISSTDGRERDVFITADEYETLAAALVRMLDPKDVSEYVYAKAAMSGTDLMIATRFITAVEILKGDLS